MMKFFNNKGDPSLDNLAEMIDKSGKTTGLSLLDDDENDVTLSGTQTPVEYFEQPKKKKGRPRKIKNVEETPEFDSEGNIFFKKSKS